MFVVYRVDFKADHRVINSPQRISVGLNGYIEPRNCWNRVKEFERLEDASVYVTKVIEETPGDDSYTIVMEN